MREQELELIENKLADIRDRLFDESDYVSEEGHDLLSSYASSPFEVLGGIEQKLLRQQKKLEDWQELFYLLKSDHEKLENFQTNNWMVKARKMGLDV